MTVIGLTGGIASGKSTVGEQLRLLGATLIDADRLGHRSYEPGSPGFEKVVNAFGHEIVGKDGVIDRRILGGKVFGAPEEMERLNTLLWPEIRRLISDELRELRRRDRHAIVVVEAAVLFEAGWENLFDEVWVVTTPTKVAVDRLMARNGLSEAQALSRLGAQMEARERNERASVKIDNSGDAAQLRGRVERAWKALVKRLDGQRPPEARSNRQPARTAAPARPKAVSRPAPAPAPARPAATRPTATRSAARTAPTRPTATRATATRTAPPRPAAARPAAARPAPRPAARPTVARPAAARPSATRPAARTTATRSAAARPTAARPAAARPTTTRSAGTRSVATRSTAARPSAARPAAARSTAARPATTRGAASTRRAAPARSAAPRPAAVAKRTAAQPPKAAARRR